MVRRLLGNERHVSGVNLRLFIPLQYSISASESFHKKVVEFKKQNKISKCEKCNRNLYKKDFNSLLIKEILRQSKVPTFDDLKELPEFNSLFKNFKSQFDVLFWNKILNTTPSEFVRIEGGKILK